MFSSTASDDGTLYRELRYSFPVGPLRRRVWGLILLTWVWRGILHNIVRGHRHPVKTYFSETVILVVWPS